MLPRPHSAVDDGNYNSIGSHTLSDAGVSANNSLSLRKRAKNSRLVQMNNRNAQGLMNTNKDIQPLGTVHTRGPQTGKMGNTSVLGAAGYYGPVAIGTTMLGVGIGAMALLKTVNKRTKFGKTAQFAAITGTVAGAFNYIATKDPSIFIGSAGLVSGLTIGANIFNVKMSPGPVNTVTRGMREVNL
tara:strand:+ start:4576 stop:5133 length:558 start_codon:yes stop_codon:yes gene_type:complete